jgi:beta-galactosidase
MSLKFIQQISFSLILMFAITSLMAQKRSNLRTIPFDLGWSFKIDNITSGPEENDFDVARWRKVDLPHDWSIEDLPNQIADSIIGPFSKASIGTTNTGFTVGGTAWYRNTFTISPKEQGKKVYIQFDGVYMNSDVWINGQHLGNHPNGYTPFYYDLTPYLLKVGKQNVIAVQVKNEGINSRWYSGSGIYRHVSLTMVNPVHVDMWGVYITTPKVSKSLSDVQVLTTVKNTKEENAAVTLLTQLIDPNGKIVGTTSNNAMISAGGKTEIKQIISINNPKLWAPDTPNLYKARVTVLLNNKIEDVVNTTFGVREIKIDAKNGLLINDVSIKLKGGCIHNDYGPLGSATIERAEERKIELLKSNGFNAIRTSHNRPSKVFLDLCDRMGMLVIDEAFDMWLKSKTNDDYHQYFEKNWNSDLTSIILCDRNHPSVLLWSVGNEIRERVEPTGLEIRKMLMKRVHELDPSRMATEAICRTPGWDSKTPPAFKDLDVCGYNYQMEKYDNDHKNFPDRIIVALESYPKDALEFWRAVEKSPFLIGDFVWTAVDYMGEAGLGASALFNTSDERVKPQWPWFNANTGDIDLVGDKKPASYYRDVVWRNSKIEMMTRKPVPTGMFEFISSWGWPDVHKSWTWPGEQGKKMNVLVYTRCQSVKLELNGKVIGEQKVPEKSITVTFDVAYQPGTLIARGYDNGKEVVSTILTTSGAPAAIRLKADRSVIKANRNDLSYVNVEIVDAKGNLVPNADDIQVNYTIFGNGELVAVGNGNPVDVSSFQQPKKKVFHGKGLAIIRPKGIPGKIILKANAHGLKADKIEIITK